jgi:hypothetical protein
MRYFSVALVFTAFYGLIGFACYYTNSAMPLWALLLTPEYKHSNED